MKDIFRLTVALVIGFTAVITKELHRIAFRKILGMLPDEFFISDVSGWQISCYIFFTFDSVPKSGDGLDVLKQGNGKAVHLVLILHNKEGIIGWALHDISEGGV